MMLPGFPEAAPLEGFVGGLLIGLAALVMLLGTGRIAGVSGMLSRAVLLNRSGTPWVVAALFVVGLVVVAIAAVVSAVVTTAATTATLRLLPP